MPKITVELNNTEQSGEVTAAAIDAALITAGFASSKQVNRVFDNGKLQYLEFQGDFPPKATEALSTIGRGKTVYVADSSALANVDGISLNESPITNATHTVIAAYIDKAYSLLPEFAGLLNSTGYTDGVVNSNPGLFNASLLILDNANAPDNLTPGLWNYVGPLGDDTNDDSGSGSASFETNSAGELGAWVSVTGTSDLTVGMVVKSITGFWNPYQPQPYSVWRGAKILEIDVTGKRLFLKAASGLFNAISTSAGQRIYINDLAGGPDSSANLSIKTYNPTELGSADLKLTLGGGLDALRLLNVSQLSPPNAMEDTGEVRGMLDELREVVDGRHEEGDTIDLSPVQIYAGGTVAAFSTQIQMYIADAPGNPGGVSGYAAYKSGYFARNTSKFQPSQVFTNYNDAIAVATLSNK